MTHVGRKNLFADYKEVSANNVVEIIKSVEADFLTNRKRCDELLVIESGIMPISRKKQVRPDIDIHSVDPIAHEITVFKEGYHWGNLINLVQRGLTDSGESDENEAIALLNECYAAENAGRKQSRLGHYVEITGIGYTFIDIKRDWVEGDSYFELETLDPRYAFVIRSSLYSDHRVILGVTFREDRNGEKYYTAFSKDYRFEITGEDVTATMINPLRLIPIIEWERSDDRMGVFEREIPEMNRLNLLLSDIANDVDQECQQIWHANDVDFPHKKDENGNDTDEIIPPKSNEWVVTESIKDGRQPFIKPLSTTYDYAGLMNNYTVARAMILQRTYTPQRNDNSGGSTGTAMSDATGWSAAEQVACYQQLLMEASKMEEVRVALEAIKRSNKLLEDNPLRKLRYIDVRPNVLRQKTYELAVKSTALSTLLAHGVYGLHALETVDMFADVTQVWEDSKELIEQFQQKAFGEEPKEEKQPSESPLYQIGNSPLIDGMSKETPIENGDTTDG